MTKTEKILACYGNVNTKSAAIMSGAAINHVYNVWNRHKLSRVNKYPNRENPKK